MDVVSNGLRFHVTIQGQGPDLLLIMGLGSPGDKWQRNVQEYQKYFRCITFDNRGAGRSDKPEMDAYSTREMAEDAVGILDALEIERAHVNGVSMGGAIAQHLAAAHPERVNRLVLTSTFPKVSNSFRRAISLLRDLKETMDSAQLKSLNQWMTFSQTIQNHNPQFLQEMADEDSAYPWPMPAFAYRAQCGACLTHDAMDLLSKITAPTLVAAGAQDLFVPLEDTMRLQQEIKGAELYLCKDGGHVHQWEYLTEYNRVSLAFLTK